MFKKNAIVNVICFFKKAPVLKRKSSPLSYLAIIGAMTLLPSYASAGEPPKLWKYNRSFAIDNCQESIATNGDKVLKDCNFFVRNYADAMLEIYDTNNKLTYWAVLKGARPSTSAFESAAYSLYSFPKEFVDNLNINVFNSTEYSWDDFRYHNGNPGIKRSEKTPIKLIKIPKDGKMVITQWSDYAVAANAWSIVLTWISKVAPKEIAQLMHGYMKKHPEVLIELATKYALAYINLKTYSNGEIDMKELFVEFEKIALEAMIDDFSSMSDAEFKAFLSSLKITKFENLTNTLTAFKGILGNLVYLKEGAELVAEFLNTAGQIMDLDNAMSAKNTDLIIENKINTPPLKPVKRFADFDTLSFYYLNQLEKQADLSFYAKNFDKIDETEVFGVDDKLDRDEFLTSLRHLMQVNGHGVLSTLSSYKIALKNVHSYIDYSQSNMSYSQAYFLIDAALTLAFDSYKVCASYDMNFVRTAFVEITQEKENFRGYSSQEAKNLYISGIIKTNQETKGTMTRRQSLALYYWLDNAIKRGNTKCEISR